MFPLSDYENLKRGYKFGQRTSYNSFHVGVDYVIRSGTPLFAPFTGGAIGTKSATGGNIITFYPDGLSYIFRMMHLQKFFKLGRVIEGEIIALTDNTGSQTTGAHLHLEVWKDSIQPNKRSAMISPDKFSWDIINHDDMFIRRPDGQISILTPERKRYVLSAVAWEKLGKPYSHNFTNEEYGKYPEAGVIKDLVF